MTDILTDNQTQTILEAQPQTLNQSALQPEETTPPNIESVPIQRSLSELLSDEFKGEKALETFKDVNSLAKSYLNAQKMIGNSVRIPTQDASKEAFDEFYSKLESIPGVVRVPDLTNPEAVNKIYTKLGKPESPEKYKFELSEEEASKLNLQEDLAAFKKMSFDMGLTNDQANALAKARIETRIAEINEAESKVKEVTSILKNKWGPEFDNRLKSANLAVNYLAEKYPESVKADLITGPAGKNPILLDMLSEYGYNLHEKGAVKSGDTIKYGTTRQQAIDRIQDMLDNKKHAYWSYHDTPEKLAALEEYARLEKIAYGELDNPV